MVKISLQLKAELENICELTACGEDFRWYIKIKCSNCGEENENWQYVTLSDKSPLKGSRGEASLVMKCKMCQRDNNSLDVLEKSLSAYVSKESGDEFQTVISFECRGLEPVDFSPRIGWHAKSSESSTVFKDVSLVEKEWVDYDEKASLSVGIYNLQHRFVKC